MHNNFIDNGFRVFPLYGHSNGQCDCGHPRCNISVDPRAPVGKHPRAGNWQKSPLWSSEQIDFMEETKQFSSGYGVLCTNLIVLDIDARNGGVESYARLCEDIPEVTGAGLIVATGSGNGSKHLYFKAPTDIPLARHISDKYKGIDFQNGSCFVVGPGSLHASGNLYTILSGSPDDIDDAPKELVDLLRIPERHRVEYNGGVVDVSYEEVADIVAAIPNNDEDYELFIRIGMAVHHSLGGQGFEIWDQWASKSSKYEPDDMDYKWHSFGKSTLPVTLGTIIHYAESNGWQRPVVFQDAAPIDTATASLDLNVDDIDLQRPPGLVGEVKAWMDSNQRYARENLTLGAAMAAVGNAMGLRYTDDITGATTNLFVFGVAGSATGKEAVLQSTIECMRVTGLSAAVHGVIKSEQETYRNLIRHQGAYYIMDELGINLRKIKNSQKGGTAYLEGVFGILMSAYSKANGYLLISGDVKEDLKESLKKELSALIRKKDNNELDNADAQIQAVQDSLNSIDNGLKDPFLSIFGLTTPETFDDLIDVEQATSGFIGRALLISEKETNPRPNKNFKPTPMPVHLVNQLTMLRHGGHFDSQENKIEYRHPRTIIPTTPEAAKFMDMALDWIIDYAEHQKAHSGLEAVVRRSYELMCKFSLTLACEGVRTLEHVRYAFKMAKVDTETKLRLVVSNDKTSRGDTKLYASITKHIDKDYGQTFGVIKNKLRSFKEDDIKKALENMEKQGAARREEVINKYNKRATERWFLTS